MHWYFFVPPCFPVFMEFWQLRSSFKVPWSVFFFHPQNASFIVALFWGTNCVSLIIQDGLHCLKIFVKHSWKTKLTVSALGWICPSMQWVASYLTGKANRELHVFYFLFLNRTFHLSMMEDKLSLQPHPSK